jgi:hypothetical protein
MRREKKWKKGGVRFKEIAVSSGRLNYVKVKKGRCAPVF